MVTSLELRNLKTGSAVLVNGKREWVTYETLNTDPTDFGAIGGAFDARHGVVVNQVNDAQVRFFRQRAVVDFVVAWMEQHRDQSARGSTCPDSVQSEPSDIV